MDRPQCAIAVTGTGTGSGSGEVLLISELNLDIGKIQHQPRKGDEISLRRKMLHVTCRVCVTNKTFVAESTEYLLTDIVRVK